MEGKRAMAIVFVGYLGAAAVGLPCCWNRYIE